MKIYSPLEQFEVIAYLGINLFGVVNLVVANVTIFLMLAFFFFSLLVLFLNYINSNVFIIFNWQVIVEGLYMFVLKLVKEQLGKNLGSKYFPILFLTFIYILFANLIGLIPYSFTTTSHIILTFLLALTYNLSFILLGIVKHGLHFFTLFIPKGIKGVLLPLIIVIEVFSYVIRSVSLSVRLFANMLAGHTLIHLILTFFLFLVSKAGGLLFIIVPFVFFYAIFILEIVIAMVQAYVFVLLVCIYLEENINLH